VRARRYPELLRNELRELLSGGFDLDLIDFEPDRLNEILAGLGSSSLTRVEQLSDPMCL
jgi:hypothetical protein